MRRFTQTKLIVPLAALLLFAAPIANAAENASKMQPIRGSWNPLRYEEGYILGALANVTSKGVVIKTLEGEVKMGVNSTHGGILSRDCYESQLEQLTQRLETGHNSRAPNEQERSQAADVCTEPLNPWKFSSYNNGLLSKFDNVEGQMIMLFYRSYYLLPLLETSNYFSDIYVINPEALPEGAVAEASPMAIVRNFHYGVGYIEGRIVKAWMNNVVRKAYEIVLQVGPSGDIYHQISVNDKKLFDFAVKAMSTGRYLKVTYYQLYTPFAAPINVVRGYQTNQRAQRLEVIREPVKGGVDRPPP